MITRATASRIVPWVLAALLAACGTAFDGETLESELLETDRAFSERSREVGAARAFAEFLHEDALLLPDDGLPVQGRGAIVAGLEESSAGWSLEWEPETARVAGDGRMGWTWGHWVLRSSDAEAEPGFGKYLNVWRRGRDGRWRVVVDMGNASPPPAGTEAEAGEAEETDEESTDAR